MKLEQLALLLKKDAAELAGSLNLQVTDEVPDEKLERLLTETIKVVELTSLSEGKRQAEGRAKKEVLTQTEKLLKERFDVDGANLEEIIESLSQKVGKVEYKTDEKVLKERDAWKQKAEKEAQEKEQLKKQFERVEVLSTVKQKLSPIMGKFEFPTERVKQIAFEQFTNNREFLISDDAIFVIQDGKPVGSFDSFAEAHFKDFGKLIDKQGVPPSRDHKSATSYGTNQKELMDALRRAKTMDEKNTILNQLKALDEKIS